MPVVRKCVDLTADARALLLQEAAETTTTAAPYDVFKVHAHAAQTERDAYQRCKTLVARPFAHPIRSSVPANRSSKAAQKESNAVVVRVQALNAPARILETPARRMRAAAASTVGKEGATALR